MSVLILLTVRGSVMEIVKDNKLLEKIIEYSLYNEKKINIQKMEHQKEKIKLIEKIYTNRLNEKPLLFGKKEYYKGLEQLEQLLSSMYSNYYNICQDIGEIDEELYK